MTRLLLALWLLGLLACGPNVAESEDTADAAPEPYDSGVKDWAWPDTRMPDRAAADTAAAPDARVQDVGGRDTRSGADAVRADTAAAQDRAQPDSAAADATTPDAAAIDAGAWPPSGHELNLGWIGGACRGAGDCDSATPICETQGFPEGMCTQACAQGASGAWICPDADVGPDTPFTVTRCVTSAAGQPRCAAECDLAKAATGCRPGYTCVLRQRHGQPDSIFPVCLPDPPQGWPGEPAPGFDIGEPCTRHADCGHLSCQDQPGGYCSKTLCDLAGCPEGSACFEVEGMAGTLCLRDCQSDAACRVDEGYACVPDADACWYLGQEIAGVNGRLQRVDGIDVLWLWGSRDQIGYAEGALLCDRVTRLFEGYVLDFLVANSDQDYATLSAAALSSYAIADGDRRELEGIVRGIAERCPAAALQLDSPQLEAGSGGHRELQVADLVVAHVLADWACSSLTVWGAASASGKTLHARNLDLEADPAGVLVGAQLVKVYRSDEEGGANWASVSLAGNIGCLSCFDGRGAGVALHNAPGLEPSSSSGFRPRVLLTRQALIATAGVADPVAAVEALLEPHPQRVGSNLHLSLPCATASCTGAAVLEWDGAAGHPDDRVTVRLAGDVDDGLQGTTALVTTNHYRARLDQHPDGSSSQRYQTLVDGILGASGGLTVAGARSLLATAAAQIQSSPTIHAVILDGASMTLRVYVAAPGGDAPSESPAVLDLTGLLAAFPE